MRHRSSALDAVGYVCKQPIVLLTRHIRASGRIRTRPTASHRGVPLQKYLSSKHDTRLFNRHHTGGRTMKRIELRRTPRCWVAETLETRDGESSIPDQELVRLFGTHILPTAYTNHAAA